MNREAIEEIAREFLWGPWTNTPTEFEEVQAVADLIERERKEERKLCVTFVLEHWNLFQADIRLAAEVMMNPDNFLDKPKKQG